MSLWNKGALVMGIKGAYAHGQLKNDYSHHMGTLFTLRLPVKLPAVIQLTILPLIWFPTFRIIWSIPTVHQEEAQFDLPPLLLTIGTDII